MKLFRSARVVAFVALVLMGTGCIFTARVDVNTNEAPADEDLPPAASPLSADGRYVAFVSNASNLGVANLPASGGLVYRRDQQTGTTTPVSVPFSGNAASDCRGQPAGDLRQRPLRFVRLGGEQLGSQ